tara:strand:+ start:658 stop:1236 length:579 start_codon:yes stop_codon:yes gene_type:complete
MNLIFASQNHNKVKELKSILPSNLTIQSLSDIGFYEDIAETSITIEGNSLLKAQTIYDKYKMNCLSDDTGLEVDFLNGEPGVFSARYAGENASSKENITKLLNRLDGVIVRSARFKTIVTVIFEGNVYQFEGIVEGEIAVKEMGINGFGYDPVFVPKGSKVSFAQMSASKKNQMSHRYLALKKASKFIEGLV